jgi:hypothetical protein
MAIFSHTRSYFSNDDVSPKINIRCVKKLPFRDFRNIQILLIFCKLTIHLFIASRQMPSLFLSSLIAAYTSGTKHMNERVKIDLESHESESKFSTLMTLGICLSSVGSPWMTKHKQL